ncbi:helix-turn-helix transcriptional regulator [Actinomadura latina]|uniref:AAA family ATPase n=1 Tax=Actinomadura latina TaxID=163603 RepID=A0A846Z5H9_9ACTN|nr:LuxR family transcriptional regulator [Actinomadura latina]NKZ06492.1 AAA family ATPase [Actinomadura latina]
MPVHDPHHVDDAGRETPFVGRERELARLRAGLERVRAGDSRLVSIDGPAGMGKTALIRRFLARAEDVLVLCASGEDSESLLPYGIVAQLVPQLAPQFAAPRDGAVPDPPVVGSALLDVLCGLQDDHVVAVVIDNAHWADLPSLDALVFTVRRLRTARVLMVVITTDAADSRLPEGLRRMLADDETTRMPLAGIGTAELRELSGRLGARVLAQRSAIRLHEHTDGNPLHARALLERVPADVLDDPYAPLPAPRSYDSLVLERFAECPSEGRLLIEAASVLGRSCTLHEAAVLSETAEPLHAAEQAVRTGLLAERPTAGGLELSFPHPLVQAAVYQLLGPARRAGLHLRASEVVPDGPARLGHRLRAVAQPDDRLAAEFAGLARRDAARGRWAEAAGHMMSAARLSTSGGERVRRTAEAVGMLLDDGQVAAARTLAGELAEDADPVALGYARGAIAAVSGRPREADAWLTGAWPHCDPRAEPDMAARVAEQLAFSRFMQGRCADATAWAERAAALAPHRPGADLVRSLRLRRLAASGRRGEGPRPTARPEPAAPANIGGRDAPLGCGLLLAYSGDLERAVVELNAEVDASPRRSVRYRLAARAALGWVEFQRGDWDAAARHANAAVSAALDAEQTWYEPMARALAVLVAAARGEWDGAAAHVQAAVRAAGRAGGISALAAAAAQAHLALARGDRGPVPIPLGPTTRSGSPWHEYVIEVLLAEGRIRQAEDALVTYERFGAAHESHFVLASAARLRGNLLAAQGDTVGCHAEGGSQRRAKGAGNGAEAAYQSGLGHASLAPVPFVQARLELDYGRFLRRNGRSDLAAVHIETAHTVFERLGARPYLQRCDRELGRRGHWPVQPTAPRAARLTRQEQAVAQLAASGLTNRQVAGELVLSVKTIEYHLSNAYSKLGVAGRTGLAALLAEHSSPGAPGSLGKW